MRIRVDGQLYDVPDDATPEEIDQISAPAAEQEQPGLLRRLLTSATTPFKAVQPIIDQQKASNPGGIVGKDSPDALAAAASFVSGIPGQQPGSPEYDQRMQRFRQEHPVASVALPLAGGLGKPAMLPASAPAAEAGPGMLESMANRLAARTVKGTATEYKNLGNEGVQDLGSMLLRRKAVRFGSSPQAVAERVAQLPEQTGKELGTAIEGLDQTGSQVSKKALADRFLQLADEAKGGGPGAVPLSLKYEKAAADVLKDIETSGEPMMSFKQAEQWKRAYQAPINYSKSTNTPLEMGSKEIASTARQGVEDAASVAGEGTQLGEQFLAAKKESGLAQQAAKMAEGGEGRRTARNMLSPSSIATNIAGVATAVATGHPMAAIPALALGPAQQILRSRGPSALAVMLNTASKGMGKVAENPAAVGRTGQLLYDLLHEGDTPRLQSLLEAIRQKKAATQQMATNEP